MMKYGCLQNLTYKINKIKILDHVEIHSDDTFTNIE